MLPVAIVSCSFFWLLAIYFSEKEAKLKKQLFQKETEYKKATEEIASIQAVLESRKATLHSLVETLTDGIVMLNSNLAITLINPQAKHMLKIGKKQISFDDLAGIFSKHLDLRSKLAIVKEQHKTIEEKEVPVGETILDITISYSNTGLLLLLKDVTMEKSIAKVKEDFTNAVVHELRSPLTAIKSATSIILDEKETLSQTTLQFLTIITSQTEKMLDDIATLLDAAKVESGRLSVSLRPANIEKMITDAIMLFAPNAQKKHITLDCDIEPDLPEANCDSGRISQVLNNLLSNSIKFTPEGGTIHISAKRNHTVHLPKTLTNPGILISISDTGIGISKEKQQNLFTKFSQAHTTVTREHHGSSGLGLYITKGIIIAHSGGIYLHSKEGKGTTISFTLPIAGQKITAKVMTAKAILEHPVHVIQGLH